MKYKILLLVIAVIIVPGTGIFVLDCEFNFVQPSSDESVFLSFVDFRQYSSPPVRSEFGFIFSLMDENPLSQIQLKNGYLSHDKRCINGVAKIVFFNPVTLNDIGCALYCRYKDTDNYINIKLHGGILEQIQIESLIEGRSKILLSHFVPLRYRFINTFYIVIIDNNILIFLNKNLYFWVKNDLSSSAGEIKFTSYSGGNNYIKSSSFIPLTIEMENRLRSFIEKNFR